MALHQVSTTGIDQALYRNCTREGSMFMWYTMLAKTSTWRGVWVALVSAEIPGWCVVIRGEGVEVGVLGGG